MARRTTRSPSLRPRGRDAAFHLGRTSFVSQLGGLTRHPPVTDTPAVALSADSLDASASPNSRGVLLMKLVVRIVPVLLFFAVASLPAGVGHAQSPAYRADIRLSDDTHGTVGPIGGAAARAAAGQLLPFDGTALRQAKAASPAPTSTLRASGGLAVK